MKTILHKLIKTVFLITIFSPLFSAFAQAPQKMSYQAVIRNSSNALVTNTSIGMKISILQASQTGIAVYVETQTAITNANGLVTLQIGAGIVVTGNFATISWGTNNYFVKTETDITGGTNYSISGTSQLLSVPYALYAASGTSGPQGLQGPIGPQGPPGSALNAWSTNGNTNTTTTDFIGTTDNKPMILKSNNLEVARTDPAGYLYVGAASSTPTTSISMLVKGRTLVTDGDLSVIKFDEDNVGFQNVKVSDKAIQSTFIDQGGDYPDVLKINPAGGNVGIGNNVNPPSASLSVARGNGVDGSAVFFGTTHASHFNYATAENTYIRGGKDGSTVLINDSHNGPVYIAGGGGDTNLGGNLSVNNTSSVNGNASFYSNINVVGGPNNGIFANTTGGFNMVPIGIFSYNLSTNFILDVEGGINNDVAPILLNATATVNPGLDDTIIFNFNLNPAVTAGYTSIIAIGNPGFNSPNFVTRATLTNDNSSVQATYVIDNLVGFRFRSYGRVMVYGIK